MRNWIADDNRFLLPKPPQWFLKELWDLDAALVILPSRVQPMYILARHRERSLRVPLLTKRHNDLMRQTQGSDGDMLASRQLLYVDKIVGIVGGTWSPSIFQSLRERDTWVAGGAEKYADKLDQQDAAAKRKRRATRADDMDHRTNDAYRSYQARTGQRIKPTLRSTSNRPLVAPQDSGSGITGIVITG